MPHLPTAPYFVWDAKTGYLEVEDIVKTETTTSRLGLISGFDSRVVVYDAEGKMWSFRLEGSDPRPSFLAKVMAQVYNPLQESAVAWSFVREYEFSELRNVYEQAVERDDDILTQFVDGEELLPRIEACRNFGELLEIWHWAYHEHESDENDD